METKKGRNTEEVVVERTLKKKWHVRTQTRLLKHFNVCLKLSLMPLGDSLMHNVSVGITRMRKSMNTVTRAVKCYSFVYFVGSTVAPLTGWYWVRILVGLALHLHITSPLCV